MTAQCESEDCSPVAPPLGRHTMDCGCRFHARLWCRSCPSMPQSSYNPSPGLVWSSLFPKET